MTRTKHTVVPPAPHRKTVAPKKRVPLLVEDTEKPHAKPVKKVEAPPKVVANPPQIETSQGEGWLLKSTSIASFGITEEKIYGVYRTKELAELDCAMYRRDGYVANPDSWVSSNGAWFGRLAHPNGLDFYNVGFYMVSVPFYE